MHGEARRRGGVAEPLPRIDWSAPWLAPLRPVGLEVQARLDDGATVAQALSRPGAPRRFVEAAGQPAGVPYETHIAATGCVPTRHGLHDLFNGLVWLTQPALKARMNALHADALAQGGARATRGPLRDALTHFDESGALLQAPAELLQALRERRWQDLFVAHRARWREASLQVVGHAPLEQLAVAPRKGLTAHVLIGSVGDALALDAAQWAERPFVPLPVLGVPHWWAANVDPAWYDDPAVFRPARRGAMRPLGLNPGAQP